MWCQLQLHIHLFYTTILRPSAKKQSWWTVKSTCNEMGHDRQPVV
jgi:hypothetical protein